MTRQRANHLCDSSGRGARSMKPWETLGQARTPDGATMTLARSGSEHVIRVDGQHLMSSRMHGSEDALAALACGRARMLPRPPCWSAASAWDSRCARHWTCCHRTRSVLVVELLAAVVVWNRSLLGELAGHPLGDPRVSVEVADVGASCARARGGSTPSCSTWTTGRRRSPRGTTTGCTTKQGLAAARAALTPGGVLAVWSAKDDRRFQQRLREAGFSVEVTRCAGT